MRDRQLVPGASRRPWSWFDAVCRGLFLRQVEEAGSWLRGAIPSHHGQEEAGPSSRSPPPVSTSNGARPACAKCGALPACAEIR